MPDRSPESPDPPALTGLRSWAEIDLDALRHNLDAAVAASRRRALGPGDLSDPAAAAAAAAASAPAAAPGPVALMPVIKANAYGHGAVAIARAAAAHEATAFLGIAGASEARQLHEAGIETRIYLLGPAAPGEREDIVRRRWTPCLSTLDEARHFNDLAGRLSAEPLPVHLAIDTGMGRGGFLPAQLEAQAGDLNQCAHLVIEGLGSHFATADEDPLFTQEQIRAFKSASRRAAKIFPALTFRHLHNSAGLLGNYELAGCNLARPGLMLYGISPIPGEQERLRPVLTLKTRVTLVRDLPAGHGISYGRTFVTKTPTRVATLGIGYGDGYPRQLSNRRTEVLLGGHRCPLLGRVTMDQIMVDVTALDPAPVPGDEAVLIGSQGSETILASELARKSDTIPWEIFTRITARVPRRSLPPHPSS